MPDGPEHWLGGHTDAVGLRARLIAGELTCVAVAEAFLAAVGADLDRAWAAVDPELVLARAAELDRLDTAARRDQRLFGVPFGIKDSFDTADLPTGYGSPIYAGHRPPTDAAAVQRLRSCGAIIAGKTRCSEFAWMFPADTLNPVDRTRTPGGSSSGSAAAVAAGTVPLALGTQTAGSINRPASYCGVLGYKPTSGSFPAAGVKPLSSTLDTVGLFARSVRDLRLAANVLAAADPRDPTLRRAQPFATGDDARERPPRLGFARTPDWAEVEPAAQAAIEAAVAAAADAGAEIEEVDLPPGFEDLAAAHAIIQWVDAAIALRPELDSHPTRISRELREALEEGAAIPLERYWRARRTATERSPAVIAALDAGDAVLTPSATGVPPRGLAFTGDPLFCRAWTLLGAPCVSVPIAWTHAPARLPAGLQLVSAPYADDRALAAAEWLLAHVGPHPRNIV